MNDYYQHISKTPLRVFRACLCDGDLKSLIISGEVEDFVLEDAWHNLKDQYATALGSHEHRLFLKLLKDVNEMAADISAARWLIDAMRSYYHEELGKMLSKALKNSFTWSDKRESINKNLDRAELLLKGVELKFKIKQESFEVMQKKMEAASGEAPTHAYFDTMLNLLEEHTKTPVDDSITVSRYCDKVQRMNNHYKRYAKK